MMRAIAAMVTLALAVFASAGCVGKPGYQEEYLRVTSARECDGAAGSSLADAPGGLIAVGVRQIKAAEGLDRQAVMLAKGRVLTASQRWFWEASPARLAEAALVRAIACRPGLVAAWPMRSGTTAALVLSGGLPAFNVSLEGPALEATLECQAWDETGAKPLASRTFSSRVAMANLDGQGIAEAASEALETVSAQAAQWLADVARARIVKQ